MNKPANELAGCRWISIPPLTDDEFPALRGAQWIGPAGDGAPRPDRLMAVAVDFTIPAGKTIQSAVFHCWVEGRPYFHSGLPEPIPADWSFVAFNGEPARDFAGGVNAGFLLMGRLLLDIRAPGFMGITPYLRAGTNTISFLSWMTMAPPVVVAVIDVVFSSGETLKICSDRSWRVQTLDVKTAAGSDWHRRLDRLEPAREYCAFGRESWPDIRARLNHPVPPVVLRRRFELRLDDRASLPVDVPIQVPGRFLDRCQPAMKTAGSGIRRRDHDPAIEVHVPPAHFLALRNDAQTFRVKADHLIPRQLHLGRGHEILAPTPADQRHERTNHHQPAPAHHPGGHSDQPFHLRRHRVL